MRAYPTWLEIMAGLKVLSVFFPKVNVFAQSLHDSVNPIWVVMYTLICLFCQWESDIAKDIDCLLVFHVIPCFP